MSSSDIAMYELWAFHEDPKEPAERIGMKHSSDVLSAIPLLTAQHVCERVDVLYNGGKLFSVDCKSNRTA
jgi:hypothetical protein